MILTEHTDKWLARLGESLEQATFVKASLGNYKGDEPALKQVIIKRVLIKKEDKLSFTYRYQTKDIVKNFTIPEAAGHIRGALSGGFNHAGLFTSVADWVLETDKKGKSHIRQLAATTTAVPDTAHDRVKTRLITTGEKKYLHELGITDKTGKVYQHAQDKYRQINHFIQITDSLLRGIDINEVHKITDMGSGKGYLSFALYDYFINVLKRPVEVTGIEFRKDLTDLCNRIAGSSGFTGLHFAEGAIEQYDSKDIDILIALHACDTATDDAIWKGIQAGARLIMVAPCCHKQIRREMEKSKAANSLDFLLRYGIFLERQAEMVTDGVRALILEHYGYTTKVFDFIADAHTPKNIMIAAVKNKTAGQRDIPAEIRKIKSDFGIGYHHLERLAGMK